jgi:hypothetical protein
MDQEHHAVELTPRPGQTDLAWYEWIVIGVAAIGGLLVCALGGRSLLASYALPTATPTLFTRPTFTPVPTPTPSPTFTPTPTEVIVLTDITVEGYVRVVDGVNFRTEPTVNGQLIRSLADGVVLKVVGGPTDADNFTWWQLQDVDGSIGWAAALYLEPVPPPAP